MNDFEIDRVFASIHTPPASPLEDRVLRSSSKALRRSFLIRKAVHRSIMTLMILLICVGAFMAGEYRGKQKQDNRVYANADKPHTVTIAVSDDFLAWVAVGRFFRQIELQDEASEAFSKAASLIPKDLIELSPSASEAPNGLFCASLANIERPSLNSLVLLNCRSQPQHKF